MKVLFRNACVVSCSDSIGDLEQADVLVSDRTIEAVGRGLDVDEAEIVEADGMLLLPGMVDSHSHLWEALFRGRVSEGWGREYFNDVVRLRSWVTPEDVYAGTYAAAVELLWAGVTSVCEYCNCIHSPEHADAVVEALKAAGIRTVFGYDLTSEAVDPAGNLVIGPPSAERFADVERVRSALDAPDSALVQLAVGLSGVRPGRMDEVVREIEFSRELGCRMSFHNNVGGEIVLLHEAGLLAADVVPVHGNFTTDDDFQLLGAVGGFLTTTTEAETYAGRRSMSMMGRAHRRGVRIALGVDVPALVNAGIMTQMRLAYFLQRYMDGVHERIEAQVPVARRPGVPTFSARDVLRFGIVNGADAIGLGGITGRIEPGLQADIVLLDARRFGMAEGDPAAHVVLNSSCADVDTVMVAGEFRKRGGQMIGVDHGKLVAECKAARDRILTAAGESTAGGMKQIHWEWAQHLEAARA